MIQNGVGELYLSAVALIWIGAIWMLDNWIGLLVTIHAALLKIPAGLHNLSVIATGSGPLDELILIAPSMMIWIVLPTVSWIVASGLATKPGRRRLLRAYPVYLVIVAGFLTI